jgi:hypothetical protein
VSESERQAGGSCAGQEGDEGGRPDPTRGAWQGRCQTERRNRRLQTADCSAADKNKKLKKCARRPLEPENLFDILHASLLAFHLMHF